MDCGSILCLVYSEPEYGESWKIEDAINYLKRFYEIEPTGCFVARVENQVVGGIFSYSYPWQSETLIYIQELFVSPKYRKNGIGKRLLKQLGCQKNTRAWLVAKENTTASVFYEKMGFKKNSPYRLNYGSIT